MYTSRRPPHSTPPPAPSPATVPRPAKKMIAHPSPIRLWKLTLIATARWIQRSLVRFQKWLFRYLRVLTPKQRMFHILAAGLIVAGILLALLLPQPTVTPATSSDTETVASGAPLPKETPTFATLLPSGKSIDELGSWRRVSPADRNPVYAFPDMLAGVSIIVSEQPIPDSFKTDIAGSVEKLSDSYSAGRTFEVDGIIVHIGKSAKGPQSVIFTKHDLLILIKSTSTIPDDKWKTYIKSLQ